MVGNQAADSQQVGSHRGGSPVGKKRHSLEAGCKDRRDMQEGSHRHRGQAEVHHICPHSEQHKDQMSCHDTSAQRVRKQKHTQTSSQIILLRRKANKNKWRMFHCKLCFSYSRCPVPKGNRYPTVGAPLMANRYPMCVASSSLQLHFSSPSNQQCYHLL